MPISLPFGSSSLLPFLHVHFHVVVNWFSHLSIPTTPNNSLPASSVKKMCLHGYKGQSEMSLSLCYHPHPPNGEPGKSPRWLQSPPLIYITQADGQLIRKSEGIRTTCSFITRCKALKVQSIDVFTTTNYLGFSCCCGCCFLAKSLT